MQKIFEYPGNLDEYYDHLSRTETGRDESRESLEKEKGHKTMHPAISDEKAGSRKRRDKKVLKKERAENRRLLRERLKPIQDELETLEGKISEKEARQKDLEKDLADPEVFKDGDRSAHLIREYRRIKEELETLILKWEQCQERLESARKNFGL